MMKQLELFPTSTIETSNYLHIEGDIPINLPNGAFISLKRNPAFKIYSLGFQPAKSIP